MAEKKKILDNLEISIREDFKPILEIVKDMEEFVEKNLIELSDNDYEDIDIDSVEDTLEELINKYDNFLEELLPLAGTVKMEKNEGATSLTKLEKFKDDLDKLVWNVSELKSIFSGNKMNPDSAKEIVLDFVKNINILIQEVRKFLSEDIYIALDNILKDIEKFERYYQ